MKNEKELEELAKKNGNTYTKDVFSNGESRKQLLARRRYRL